MPGRARIRAVLVAAALLHLRLPASAAPMASGGVQRIKVDNGGKKFIPVPGLLSVVVTDPSSAEVSQGADGFTVFGRRSGDVIVQAFTASGMRVYIVVIEAPRGPEPGAWVPTSDQFGEVGGSTSFWGINKYDAKMQIRSHSPSYLTQALTLSGKLAEGDHRLETTWTSSSLDDHRLDTLRGSWLSKDRRKAVEVGDIAPTVTGSRQVQAVPLAGAKARVDWRPTWTELSLGMLRDGFDRLSTDRPAVGIAAGQKFGMVGSEAGRSATEKRRGQGEVVASALGYQTPEASGFLTGTSGRARLFERTLVEGRASFVGDNRDGEAASRAASVGASASYVCPTASYAANVEANSGGFRQPQTGAERPAGQSATASARRKLGSWLTGAAAIGHTRARVTGGEVATSSSLSTSMIAALGGKTTLSVAETETMLPGVAAAAASTAPVHRRQVTAMVAHQPDQTSRVEGNVDYVLTRYGNGATRAANARLTGSRKHAHWAVQGSAGMLASKTSVGGAATPTTYLSSIAGSAQVFRGPLQLQASASVQQMLAPTQRTGVNGAVGVGFTPTTATKVSASVEGSREATDGDLRYGASLGLTHFFGDAVKSRPILGALTEGEVAGTLCIDANQDGECQQGETPIAGVEVKMGDRKAVSDARGAYRFKDVEPGNYTLAVDEASLRKQGRMTTSSTLDVRVADGKTEKTTFAITTGCEIAGSVVDDLDLDGVRDEDDSRFAGVGLTITGMGETIQTQTDGIGIFSAIVPRCGDYTVALDLGSLPPSTSAVVDEVPVSVTSSEGRASVDLIAYAIRAVQGQVFEDLNRNGKLDKGEPGVPGATVRWAGGTVTTDDTGAYLLRRLPVGQVKLRVDFAGLPPESSPGKPAVVEFEKAAKLVESVNLPVSPGVPANNEVSGRVFKDSNRNGVLDRGETTIAGATIRWPGGTVVTDRAGRYTLRGLPAGALKLRVDFARLPAGVLPGKPVELVLGRATETHAVDVPVLPPAAPIVRALRGRVFVDANKNGVLDGGEKPVAGAEVRWNGGSVTTDRNGRYVLDRLPAGPIKLRVAFANLPEGVTPGRPVELELADETAPITRDLPVNGD
jgi:hypothetical protein